MVQTVTNFSSADAADFRLQRIRYAVAASIVGKIVTTAVQIFVMPVAIRALGPEQFALYAMVAAALTWVGLANVGIGPILTVEIAAARTGGERLTESRLFTSALLPVLALMIVIGLVFGSIILLGPVATIFGASYSQYMITIRFGLLLLLGVTLLQSLASVVEAAQMGHQEQYVFNLWMAFGGILTLIALTVSAKLTPTVISLILAVNAPPLVSRLVNATRFMRRNTYLIPRLQVFDWSESKKLLISGFAYSLVGIGAFLTNQFPIIAVGRALDPLATATFAALLNAFTISFGLVTMLAAPMLPAMADSMARREVTWAHKAYVKLVSVSMIYASLVGVGFAVIGQWIFLLWFGQSINASRSLVTWLGLYCVLAMWEYVHYVVLMGLKQIRIPSVIFLARSLLAVALMLVFVRIWAGNGVMIGLCLSVIVVTGWSFPYMARLTFKRAKRDALNHSDQEASAT